MFRILLRLNQGFLQPPSNNYSHVLPFWREHSHTVSLREELSSRIQRLAQGSCCFVTCIFVDIFIINGKIFRNSVFINPCSCRVPFHLNCIHLAMAILYSIIANKRSFNLSQSTGHTFMPILLFLCHWPVLIFDHLGFRWFTGKSILIPVLPYSHNCG